MIKLYDKGVFLIDGKVENEKEALLNHLDEHNI